MAATRVRTHRSSRSGSSPTPALGAGAKEEEGATLGDGIWTEQDKQARDKCLRRMIDPKPPRFGDPFYDPGGGPLLCLPREQLQERVYNIFQNNILLYGLIFSGVASSALEPFEVREFESSTHRLLANAYNLLATVQFIICTFSMWQAVMLSLAACVESDITIYRFTVHASRSAWSLSCNTGYSCVLLTAQVLIVVYVRSDPVWAWSILTIVCFQFLYLVYVYWPRYNRAVPYLGLHSFNNPILGHALRLGIFGPGYRETKKHADTIGAVKAREAVNNFGREVVDGLLNPNPNASKMASSGHVTEAAQLLAGASAEALLSFISKVLKDWQEERVRVLCKNLMILGLDLETLAASGRTPMVLDCALRDTNLPLDLLAGERLRLVAAAAQISVRDVPDLRLDSTPTPLKEATTAAQIPSQDVHLEATPSTTPTHTPCRETSIPRVIDHVRQTAPVLAPLGATAGLSGTPRPLARKDGTMRGVASEGDLEDGPGAQGRGIAASGSSPHDIREPASTCEAEQIRERQGSEVGDVLSTGSGTRMEEDDDEEENAKEEEGEEVEEEEEGKDSETSKTFSWPLQSRGNVPARHPHPLPSCLLLPASLSAPKVMERGRHPALQGGEQVLLQGKPMLTGSNACSPYRACASHPYSKRAQSTSPASTATHLGTRPRLDRMAAVVTSLYGDPQRETTSLFGAPQREMTSLPLPPSVFPSHPSQNVNICPKSGFIARGAGGGGRPAAAGAGGEEGDGGGGGGGGGNAAAETPTGGGGVGAGRGGKRQAPAAPAAAGEEQAGKDLRGAGGKVAAREQGAVVSQSPRMLFA